VSFAEVANQLGRTEPAWQQAREGLCLFRECDDRRLTLYSLALLASFEAEAGRAGRAGVLWGAIEAEESRGPVGNWESERDEFASSVINPSPEFEQGRSAGRSLSLDEAVEYGLGED
jgi:hypothetical protein